MSKDDEIRKLLEQAEKSYNEEKYEEAIQDYTKAIELKPDVEFFSSRGNSYINIRKFEEAIQDYNKVLESIQYDQYAYVNRGYAYAMLKQYKEAVCDFTEAIELEHTDIIALTNRGHAYSRLEKNDEALDDFSKAIKFRSNIIPTHIERGHVYHNLGRYDEALEDYNKALECSTDSLLFFKYVSDFELNNNYLSVKLMYLWIKIINKVTEFKFDIKNKQVVHYTKIDTIKNLFVNEKSYKNLIEYDKGTECDQCKEKMKIIHELSKPDKSNIPRLRLYNTIYTNDPTEGQLFEKLLLKTVKKMDVNDKNDKNDKKYDGLERLFKIIHNEEEKKHTEEIITNENNTFLTSFSTTLDDSLPMWVQYTNDSKGCGIVFDDSFFDKEDNSPTVFTKGNNTPENNNSGEKYCLYSVNYDENDLKLEDWKNIINVFVEISNILTKLNNNIDEKSIQDYKNINAAIGIILDQIRFLYKSKDFAYEKEVRIIKFALDSIRLTDSNNESSVPRLYIDIEKELDYSKIEVILGPKVNKPKDVANYLYHTGVRKVTKSKIKYQ